MLVFWVRFAKRSQAPPQWLPTPYKVIEGIIFIDGIDPEIAAKKEAA